MKNVPKQATAKSSIQKKVRPRKAGGKKLSQKCKTDSKKCVLSIRTDNGQSSINPSDGSVEDEASTSPTPFSTNDAMLGNGSDSKDFHENSGVSASATAVKPQNRYILFVGNLPYGATAAAIQKFFKSQGAAAHLLFVTYNTNESLLFLDVIGVRLLSSKDTKKPRGCAFVEFSSAAGYKVSKRCQDLNVFCKFNVCLLFARLD